MDETPIAERDRTVRSAATTVRSTFSEASARLTGSSELRDVDGINISKKRRSDAFEGDYQPVWGPLLVRIDMGAITLR